MKKKIGEIYNKPIVTGDKNLVTKNEIHESTLKGGGTVDSGSSDVEYFKIDWNVASSDWEKVLLVRYDNDAAPYNPCKITSRSKVNMGDVGIVICANDSWTKEQLIAFSYTPILLSKEILSAFNLGDKSICNFNDIVLVLNALMIAYEGTSNLSMKGITPITKEEFYDLNNI